MKAKALADILFTIILSFTVHASGLRVHVEYVDNHFTSRTQHIVREAVFHISRLLSIQNKLRKPVFHVPREKNACVSIYFDGPNKGKCGQISKHYLGIEKCGEAKIPQAHLEGLQVFGPKEVEPLSTSLPQGHGFTDGTNFVVYLTSKQSKLCSSSLAHSHVCRMEASRIGGVHSGRPVAGTINACWKEGETDDIMIKRVVIHELIHLLGMNYRSIREFIECDSKGNTRMCWKLKERVLWVTQDGELVLWSKHFRKAIRHQKICLDGTQCQISRWWLGQAGRRAFASSSTPSLTTAQPAEAPQAPQALQEAPGREMDYVSEQMKNTLKHPDYFKVSELFTVEDLFNARVHLGHTEGSLDEHMSQFVFGSRLGYLIIDLDQTAGLLRDALNFIAHIAFRGGIILFIGRTPQHQVGINHVVL
ncbi:28S ribosomal protein S2, mitochondrial [Portunus trituberculatus]|uniref:28S ribosomal protein S2, mitochondrial n=1 Tax=Portunus trituberculatus TaxID=210409 RepID=A0A5B7FLS0_PORTR|nr:28S ribosomal protein S2, mitochondrial [Portunus trituberculatus]